MKVDLVSRRTVETAALLAGLKFYLCPNGLEGDLFKTVIERGSHQMQHFDKDVQSKVSKAKQKAYSNIEGTWHSLQSGACNLRDKIFRQLRDRPTLFHFFATIFVQRKFVARRFLCFVLDVYELKFTGELCYPLYMSSSLVIMKKN